MLRKRQAQLSIIPPQLKAMYRWVLKPRLTHITAPGGGSVSASDQTAWMPYSLAADIFLRKGTTIGFVAGDGVSFIRGECPDFVKNPGAMWRWRLAFTLRSEEHIFFVYAGGDTTKNGRKPNNHIGSQTFGFSIWLFRWLDK